MQVQVLSSAPAESKSEPLKPEKSRRWSIYLVRCRDRSLYTGVALDVARRFAEHRESGGRGAKYLSGRGPLRLVFHHPAGSRSRALRIEHRIKRMPKAKKEQMVRSGALPESVLD